MTNDGRRPSIRHFRIGARFEIEKAVAEQRQTSGDVAVGNQRSASGKKLIA
jgi:hypothetical protein